jgi:hypothetical protein
LSEPAHGIVLIVLLPAPQGFCRRFTLTGRIFPTEGNEGNEAQKTAVNMAPFEYLTRFLDEKPVATASWIAVVLHRFDPEIVAPCR